MENSIAKKKTTGYLLTLGLCMLLLSYSGLNMGTFEPFRYGVMFLATMFIASGLYYAYRTGGYITRIVLNAFSAFFSLTALILLFLIPLDFETVSSNIFLASCFFLTTIVFGLQMLKVSEFEASAKFDNNRGYFIESLLLIAIILNFFVIATNNLDLLPPQNDEFLTYEAVSYILNEGLTVRDLLHGADSNASQNFYSRALPYSISVAATTKFLGGDVHSMHNLRYFSVLCGAMSIILLYAILRRDTWYIYALTATYFFSIFYLFLYHSRVSRMYSLVLLITLAISLLVLVLLNRYRSFLKSLSEDIQSRYFLPILYFIKTNLAFVSLLVILVLIGLKTHYNIAFIIFPALLFGSIYAASKQLRVILGAMFSTAVILLILNSIGFGPIGEGYFNQSMKINTHYINRLTEHFSAGLWVLAFFFTPILLYRKLPISIKYSYIVCGFIFSFYLFFANGIQFHDPRYFIFVFPFFIAIVVYGILTLIKSLAFFKIPIATFGVLFILASALFINKPMIVNFCPDSKLLECPISHESRVFLLDRWNYRYDEMYQAVADIWTNDTVFISRTPQQYYADIHNISDSQQCKLIRNYAKQRECTWEDVSAKRIIFVMYPQLIYPSFERTDSLEAMYKLLEKEERSLIYESYDKKIVAYLIDRDGQKSINARDLSELNLEHK